MVKFNPNQFVKNADHNHDGKTTKAEFNAAVTENLKNNSKLTTNQKRFAETEVSKAFHKPQTAKTSKSKMQTSSTRLNYSGETSSKEQQAILLSQPINGLTKKNPSNMFSVSKKLKVPTSFKTPQKLSANKWAVPTSATSTVKTRKTGDLWSHNQTSNTPSSNHRGNPFSKKIK